jgi:cytoskeletal protein CcmA (bactofilin family)
MLRGIGKRTTREIMPIGVALPFTPRPPETYEARTEGEEDMALTEARPGTSSELNALLGRGSEFDGKLTFEGTVRIDGAFSGEITTTDTLIVGEGAKVQAEITCGSLVVHGEIVGNVNASSSVELHRPARVKGDITTPSLMVERGVLFQGGSKMTEQAANNVVRFGGVAEAASD